MRITLEQGPYGSYVVRAADGRTRLTQVDWDFPGLASTFGMTRCCDATDGTVDCEHKLAGDHIADAAEYLSDHIGEEVEDPGYFDEEA